MIFLTNYNMSKV